MKEVERFYDDNVQNEWDRLERHPMEYATTCKALDAFLPKSGMVLDVGGGPGRYAFYLAEQGHHVTLLDLARRNVAFARRKALELNIDLTGYIHGNALDLSQFKTGSFDAVLLLGPLYHLLEDGQRRQAIAEAVRVLKQDGVLFLGFITRYSFIVDMLKNYPYEIDRFQPQVIENLLADGINIVSTENPGFTNAYFAHPMEIEPLAKSFNLATLRIAAAEGISAPNEDQLRELEAATFSRWVDLMYDIGEDPITWGAAEHMLYVGRKQ